MGQRLFGDIVSHYCALETPTLVLNVDLKLMLSHFIYCAVVAALRVMVQLLENTGCASDFRLWTFYTCHKNPVQLPNTEMWQLLIFSATLKSLSPVCNSKRWFASYVICLSFVTILSI